MESFVYSELNIACRSKEKDQIKTFGPYAAAISYIIYFANKRRDDKITGETILYRGLKLTEDAVKMFEVGNKINITGYTSSSREFEVAKSFAVNELKDGQVAVVYKINFKGQVGLFEMNEDYSAYNEMEVLI